MTDGRPRKLRRSRNNLLVGVCGGIAEYLGWPASRVPRLAREPGAHHFRDRLGAERRLPRNARLPDPLVPDAGAGRLIRSTRSPPLYPFGINLLALRNSMG